jgi:two-component system sensor histidine kinase TctE
VHRRHRTPRPPGQPDAGAAVGRTGRRHASLASPRLPELIRERSPEWIRLAEARAIDLGFELHPAQVTGDRLLLGEMIANLVINAIHYTPAQGEVTVRCHTAEGHSIIEVEDNGPGIPPALREHVFERFFRLPGVSGPGSGLGWPSSGRLPAAPTVWTSSPPPRAAAAWCASVCPPSSPQPTERV